MWRASFTSSCRHAPWTPKFFSAARSSQRKAGWHMLARRGTMRAKQRGPLVKSPDAPGAVCCYNQRLGGRMRYAHCFLYVDDSRDRESAGGGDGRCAARHAVVACICHCGRFPTSTSCVRSRCRFYFALCCRPATTRWSSPGHNLMCSRSPLQCQHPVALL